MQFPESWLRSFCNPPLTTEALADTLTMAGLEVEALSPAAPMFSSVVVGEILSADPHPHAERLKVCQVRVGSGEPLQIVCGASNARVGIRVPCALVGAMLPGEPPVQIRLAQLRGVASHGMLCSAKELGLSDDQEGLLELGPGVVPGQDVRQALDLDDTVFTLKLTPNLAHCLSVYGIARELSALTGAPLRSPEATPVPPRHGQRLPVTVHAPELCGRFSGRVIRGIDPQAHTPQWMVQRLARCGQRSVSALVDISNYVMFEWGQPTHVFDLDRIHGGLHVRWARQGESLKLLNGQTVTLTEDVGVIADERQVESLAGIMGGDATAVGEQTRNVYVEAAFWWPRAVAGRSRRYRFATEAGHRFERGVDPQQTVACLERITQLIVEICGGEPGPVDDQCVHLPEPKPVRLRVSRASRVLGMPLTEAQCASALRGLGLQVSEAPGELTVVPPSYRFDLSIEEDLIEEVARVVGFDRLPTTPPVAPITARPVPEDRRSDRSVAHALAALGYQETINFSFVDERWETGLHGNPDPIRLLNPIASQMGVMRSSLLGSLLQVAKFNRDRKASRVWVFELGRVFRRDGAVPDSDQTVGGIDQPMHVAGLASGDVVPLHWDAQQRRPVDFFDVKGHVERLFAPRGVVFERAAHPAMHPGRCARIVLQGQTVGHVGELHPKWRQEWGFAQAPVMFELSLQALLQREVAAFAPFSKFQPVERDLAVWVPESVTHDALVRAVRQAPTKGWLREVAVFDIFRPAPDQTHEAGQKSVALRVVLNRSDAGLTDAEVDGAVQAIVSHLGDELGARLRG